MIDSLQARNLRDWAREDLRRYKDAQKEIDHHVEDIERLRRKSENWRGCMIDSLRARQLRDLAREDLGKYINAQKDIAHHWAKIDELRTRAQRLSKPLDPNKVQVQSSNNGPEEILCTIADMQLEHRKKQLLAEQTCMEIAVRIGELESVLHQRILRDYWLYNQTLQSVSVMEGYTYDWIRHLHNQALEAYGEKLHTPKHSNT